MRRRAYSYHAVGKKLFQFAVEKVGKFFESCPCRVKFIGPGSGLRRQRSLTVNECDPGLRSKRCQHRRELLQHGLYDLCPGIAGRKLAQIKGGLQPRAEEADPAAIRKRKVIALKNEVRAR